MKETNKPLQEEADFYDEDASLAFIRNYLPQEIKDKFGDEDIRHITDLVGDFYASKGFLDESDEEAEKVDIDLDELSEYVVRNAHAQGLSRFLPEEIRTVLSGEIAYCESAGLFDD